MSDFIVKPSQKLSGEILVPGDKSISHRAIMLGSLAEGTTKISGFLEGEDSLATLNAFVSMGVNIEQEGQNIQIGGVGMGGLKPPKSPIYLGNSGTSMRLMSGILAAQNFSTTLLGDASLLARPMQRIIKPLSQMGAKIKAQKNGNPPLQIIGGQSLVGIDYHIPIVSAQVKSCLLFAAMFAQGRTNISEPSPSRDHSERMLRRFSYPITVKGNQISIMGKGVLSASNIMVPADISSAAFFMVAACIAPSADITLKSVNINPTRTGVIDILKLMGANLTLLNQTEVGTELLADIRVKSSDLVGVEIPQFLVPLAIDEFPAIFIAASCAQGTTILTGAKELRVKESDRIATMAAGLIKLGVACEVAEDGITINGRGTFSPPTDTIESHNDHRISMAFSLVGFRCSGKVQIKDCHNVASSFPNFIAVANKAGMNINNSD